jgi:hypothetical protein
MFVQKGAGMNRPAMIAAVCAIAVAAAGCSSSSSSATRPPSPTTTAGASSSAADGPCVYPRTGPNLATQPNDSTLPYPLNWDDAIVLTVHAPPAVSPHQSATVVLEVTNLSQDNLDTYDLTLGLMDAPDCQTPLDFATVVAHDPPVKLDPLDSSLWLVGTLEAGQTKTYTLRVKLPVLEAVASTFCFIGYVGMTSSLTTAGAWTKQGLNPSCSAINRQ